MRLAQILSEEQSKCRISDDDGHAVGVGVTTDTVGHTLLRRSLAINRPVGAGDPACGTHAFLCYSKE